MKTSTIPEHLHRAVEFDEGYFEVPLEECREPLESLPDAFACQNVNVSFDVTSIGRFPKLYWVRQGLIPRLIRVSKRLHQHQLRLHFVDGFRHFEQQRLMFQHTVQRTRAEFPNESAERILELAGVYAAINPATAAHMAGAAVDVVLKTAASKFIDMGAEYLEDSARSETYSPEISLRAKNVRRLLCDCMEAEGFANYPFAYWHFSHGDRLAAYIQGKPFAKYGPINFTPTKGITHFFTTAEAQQVFELD